MRHKIKQLSDIRSLNHQVGVQLIKVYEKNIISTACVSVQLCIKGANICIQRGVLNLSRKGYKFAWSLQNPYVTKVPKLGIAVRVRFYLISLI